MKSIYAVIPKDAFEETIENRGKKVKVLCRCNSENTCTEANNLVGAGMAAGGINPPKYYWLYGKSKYNSACPICHTNYYYLRPIRN